MPTAPVAPETAIGPLSRRRPLASKRSSAMATVKPGTPMAATSSGDRPIGSFCKCAAGTRMRAQKPPS